MQKITQAFLLLFTLTSWAFGQTPSSEASEAKDDITIIRDFIHDIADEKIRPDVILTRHVLMETTKKDEEYDYLEASIEEIRINLQPKNIDEIAYIAFQDMPKRETHDIDPEGKPTDKMYFLQYRKRQMLAVYIAEGKIASFTLVSKGRQAHFVTY